MLFLDLCRADFKSTLFSSSIQNRRNTKCLGTPADSAMQFMSRTNELCWHLSTYVLSFKQPISAISTIIAEHISLTWHKILNAKGLRQYRNVTCFRDYHRHNVIWKFHSICYQFSLLFHTFLATITKEPCASIHFILIWICSEVNLKRDIVNHKQGIK